MKVRTLGLMTSAALVAVASVFACTGTDATTGTLDGGPDARFGADSSSPEIDSSSPAADAAASDGSKPDSAVDAGPLPPTSLGTRLVLWLAADKGFVADGGSPLVWKDQSGAGNDAVQETVASQPQLLDGSAGGASGRATVHFTGNEYLQIADQDSLQWATSDFSVFVVERHTNDTASYALLYAKWTDVYPFPGFFLWADYPTTTSLVTRLDINNAAFSDDAGYDDGTLRVVGMRKNGADLQLYANSALAGENPDASVVDPTGFNAVGLPAYLGGRPSGIQMLQGDISEVVAVKGTLSNAELANLQAYLKSKYKL